MTSSVSKLGKRVKAIRLEKGWSQKKMADVLGISRATIIRLEQGTSDKGIWDLTRARIERGLDELQPQTAVA